MSWRCRYQCLAKEHSVGCFGILLLVAVALMLDHCVPYTMASIDSIVTRQPVRPETEWRSG